MKGIATSLFERPTLVILLAGLASLLLAAAGTITVHGETIAIADPVWRIVLSSVGGLLILFGVALIARDVRSPRPTQPFKLTYDVFLASPMQALDGDAAYNAQRADTLRVKEALRAHSATNTIYDAGEKLTVGRWDPQDVAAEVDLEALRHSRYFLLLYPERITSSVLFEAGYAVWQWASPRSTWCATRPTCRS